MSECCGVTLLCFFFYRCPAVRRRKTSKCCWTWRFESDYWTRRVLPFLTSLPRFPPSPKTTTSTTPSFKNHLVFNASPWLLHDLYDFQNKKWFLNKPSWSDLFILIDSTWWKFLVGTFCIFSFFDHFYLCIHVYLMLFWWLYIYWFRAFVEHVYIYLCSVIEYI